MIRGWLAPPSRSTWDSTLAPPPPHRHLAVTVLPPTAVPRGAGAAPSPAVGRALRARR